MLVKYRHDVRPLPIPNPFPPSPKTGNQGTCPAGWNTQRGPGSETGHDGRHHGKPPSGVKRMRPEKGLLLCCQSATTTLHRGSGLQAQARGSQSSGSPPPWPWPAVACLELVHKSMASFPPSPRFLGTARSCHDLRISGRSLLNPLCDSPARQKGLLA